MDLTPGLVDDPLCRICRAASVPFEKAVAWGVYRDHLRALLHLLKYDGMRPIAGRLGALLAQPILAIPGLPTSLIVVPVPLYRPKRRRRGFNQAEVLARGAIAVLHRERPELHVQLAAGVLERQRSTESQAGLSPHQRRMNVRGAFFVSAPDAIAGQDVLLIDDIYTTGATARACSQALRRAGAASVWVATVARAQKDASFRYPFQDGPETTGPDIPMEEDVAFWEESRAALTAGMAR